MIVVLKSKNETKSKLKTETKSKLSCTIIIPRRRLGLLHILASFRVFHSGTYRATAQKQLGFLQNQQRTISSSSPVLRKQLTRVRYKFYNQFTSSSPQNNFCIGKKWKLIEGLAGKIAQQGQDISQLSHPLHNSSFKDKNKLNLNPKEKGNIRELDSSRNFSVSLPSCKK